MSRRSERGVALLAATAALAVLAALATGLAYTTTVDQHLAHHALAALQADALARSGVAVAAVVLRESGADGAPDTLRAPWTRPSGRRPLGAGWVEARIEDEARRLDLGAGPLADALPRLLRALDLDAGLAEAIADWTDADDAPRPAGAERDWYLGLRPPYLAANRPLASVGELRLVRGVRPDVLARLAPHVTTVGERAVNPNTASREVLLAVVGDVGTVARLLDARARGPITEEDLPALLGAAAPALRRVLTMRGQHYTVRATAAAGGIERGVEAILRAPAGVEPEVVAWRPLRRP